MSTELNTMIKHIGLQVIEKDIDAFCVDLLHFKCTRTFVLSEKEANEIFNIKKSVQILSGSCDGMEFELFIDKSPTVPTFTHVGFQTEQAAELAEQAKIKGYSVFIRNSGKSETWFISDSNYNLFEIKNIQHEKIT